MFKAKRRFRRTTAITLGLAAFLAGLGFARLRIELSPLWLIPAAILVAVSARRMGWAVLAGVLQIGFLLGWLRGQDYMQKLAIYTELYDRTVTIVGRADNDGIYGRQSQISFDLKDPVLIEPEEISLAGKIGVNGFGVNSVYSGDLLQIEGKLRQTRGAKQANVSFAQIKLLDSQVSPVDTARRRFQAGMQSALPEPLASFGLGLLIGQRDTLPSKTSRQLAAVGLTHIVAVSGYNLTIIIRAVRRLLKKRSKYQSTVLSVALIGLFLLFTGSSPSITRAAIISILSLAAWYYGRVIKPVLLLLLAAALTAGFYPIYIWSDIGWYLSFLAFFGVLIMAPLIAKRIYKKKNPSIVALLMIESFSAQIVTMPLILYIFKEVSIIALPANMLLVLLVPLAMGLALITGLAGAIIPSLAGWFAWPARLVLTYMLDMVSILSRIPHALTHRILSLSQMLGLYGCLLAVTSLAWHKTRSKNATITDKNLII